MALGRLLDCRIFRVRNHGERQCSCEGIDRVLNEKHAGELDREMFVRLLMRHDRVIRAFLRGLLPTATDVDEVMQEVSVIA